MIVQGCGVVMVAAVTGEARQPSPKSPWSRVRRGVVYIGSPVEFVLRVFNGFIWYYPKIICMLFYLVMVPAC